MVRNGVKSQHGLSPHQPLLKSARRVVFGVVVIVSSFTIGACSSDSQTTICANIESLSLAVGSLSGGAELLAGEVAGTVDTNISNSLVVLDSLSVEAPTGVLEKVTSLKSSLAEVQQALDDINWDFELVSTDDGVREALIPFDGVDVVSNVTAISNYVNGVCSTGATVDPSNDGLGTLPSPEISTPPITDPPTGVVDNGSDARAIGFEIATAFGITASEEQLVCLGTELQDVEDVSGEQSTTGAYNSQFQKAFDACGIDFTVPGN